MGGDAVEVIEPEIFQSVIFVYRVLGLKELEEDPEVVGVRDPGFCGASGVDGPEVVFDERREFGEDVPEPQDVVLVGFFAVGFAVTHGTDSFY